jgi:DNA transformation protein
MGEIKGERLYVTLGASQARRRLKGHGFGVRKVHSDGKNRAVIIHTATGDHLRDLEALFKGLIRSPNEDE